MSQHRTAMSTTACAPGVAADAPSEPVPESKTKTASAYSLFMEDHTQSVRLEPMDGAQRRAAMQQGAKVWRELDAAEKQLWVDQASKLSMNLPGGMTPINYGRVSALSLFMDEYKREMNIDALDAAQKRVAMQQGAKAWKGLDAARKQPWIDRAAELSL